MNSNRLTTAEARDQGLHPLTVDYLLPQEQWMLDNVIRDMHRGGIEFALVKTGSRNIEVWRKPSTARKSDGLGLAA